jgi:hypothetical protein
MVYLLLIYLKILFSNSDYIASNERVISEWRIVKRVKGSGRGLKIKVRNISQNSRTPDRHSNPGPSEYEAGVFTTRPRRCIPVSGSRPYWRTCCPTYITISQQTQTSSLIKPQLQQINLFNVLYITVRTAADSIVTLVLLIYFPRRTPLNPFPRYFWLTQL